jgi:galactose mutarotase-like enzyme
MKTLDSPAMNLGKSMLAFTWSSHTYRQSDGFTLETQHYPDNPHHINQSGWPSVVLNPGAAFDSTTAYQFGLENRGFTDRIHFH